MVAQPDAEALDRAIADIDRQIERVKAHSFEGFLPHWRFVNRETGDVQSFANLWPGQQRLVQAMHDHSWLLALKAGKLGFTELECAYDAWVTLMRAPNARVHLFSKNGEAARDLLQYVRFGLMHLPDHLRPKILADKAGGDTVRSLRVQPPPWLRAGPEDFRTIMSYNTERSASVEATCNHAHLDELWAHPTPHETWSAIASTVAPGGSCHVITRGGGEANYVTTLWTQAQTGESEFFPFFEPWTGRPDRDHEWYENQATKMVGEQLLRFAPETPEDALESTDIQSFVPITLFDACRDVNLPVWIPDRGEVGVLAVDAGVHSDCFAVVAVTRHPNRPADPAIRAVKVWQPTPGRPVDLRETEAFIRRLCFGGCMAKPGHPLKPFSDQIDERYSTTNSEGQFQCLSCREPEARIPAYRIWEITYDPSQMLDMAQRLTREGLNCHSFDQTSKRAVADRQIYDMIVSGRLAHNGDGSPDVRYEDSALRQHVKNAAVQLQAKEESKMRIVKKGQSGGKIDALVAASMGVNRCLYLMLAPSRPA